MLVINNTKEKRGGGLPWITVKGGNAILTPKSKIDRRILDNVYDFFLRISKEHNTEACVWVCPVGGLEHITTGDLSKVQFDLVIPALCYPYVSGGSVKRHQYNQYCPICKVTAQDKCVICGNTELKALQWFINIHSHNSMRAFWSGIDDAAHICERGFYIVIGLIQADPELMVSYTDGAKRNTLRSDDLFSTEATEALISEEQLCLWSNYYGDCIKDRQSYRIPSGTTPTYASSIINLLLKEMREDKRINYKMSLIKQAITEVLNGLCPKKSQKN